LSSPSRRNPPVRACRREAERLLQPVAARLPLLAAWARGDQERRLLRRACRGKSGKVSGAIKHKKTVIKQLVFTCSVPKSALLVAKPAGGGLKLDAGSSGSHIVSASL
jgi:hypothetical protein